MALIGKIRQNTIIVLLFIGGGVALFIMSEMMNGAGGNLGPVMNRMGAVGETEIDRGDFDRTAAAAFSGGDNFANRDQLWNFYVTEAIVSNEADQLGLTVSADEMEELQFGNNPSPVIQRNFADPQTGQMNRTMLNQIKQSRDAGTVADDIQNGVIPDVREFWKYQTRDVRSTRLQEKMTALVTKAMYAPQFVAEAYANDQAGSRRAAVVKIPFEEVDNTEVEVSDADIQAYMDEYRAAFNNPEETRQLSYVAFPVSPTAADSAELRTKLNDLATQWRQETTETGDSLFALGANGNYQAAFLAEKSLSPIVADAVLNQIEPGTVFGPYLEGDAMKLLKLIDRQVMADSAKGRVILRQAQTPDQFPEAERIVDSLLTVFNRSTRNFTELAEKYNQYPGITDGVIANATPGQYPRAIDNVLFQTGTVGQFTKVRAPFGWLLVETTSRSRTSQPRAKVAYIVEPIIPSSATEQAVRSKARAFAKGKTNFSEIVAAAEAAGMEAVTTGPLPVSNYALQGLGSGQDVRDMMCWAFSADKGDVSPDVYSFTDPQLFYQNNHLLVGLADVVPEGMPGVAAVREQLEPIVRNRVKGEKLKGMLAGKSLSALASEYDTDVDTISSNPTLQSLPVIGNEPKVIAAIAAAATGSVSTPVIGQNGVYLIQPLNDAPAANSGRVPQARQELNTTTRNQAAGRLMLALRVNADVADERSDTDCRN